MEHSVDKIDRIFTDTQSGNIYRVVIDRTEKILIEKALEKSSGNQIAASKILGLNRNTLRYKIKKLNISPRYLRSYNR